MEIIHLKTRKIICGASSVVIIIKATCLLSTIKSAVQHQLKGVLLHVYKHSDRVTSNICYI